MSNNPKYQYIPITAVFAKLVRDLGLQTVDEGDVIEWTGEALEAIGAAPMYEQAIALVEVRNHQCEVPNGTQIIDSIARNNRWIDKGTGLCPTDILRDIQKHQQDVSCKDANDPCFNTLPIPLDCKGSPLMDYSVAYYRPYFDLIGEYYGWNWNNSALYGQQFTPVRLSTSDYGLMMPGLDNLSTGDSPYTGGCNRDEYIVIKKKIIRFSFRTGQVAISYKRPPIDEETGYPLIPDNYAHKTAITNYITMKMMARDFYAGREGAKGRMDKAEADWQWYCGQASSFDLMPRGIDEHQNLYDQRTRFLPNDRQYYSFFGKMNVPEGRKYNDPDRRNYSLGFFRGTQGISF